VPDAGSSVPERQDCHAREPAVLFLMVVYTINSRPPRTVPTLRSLGCLSMLLMFVAAAPQARGEQIKVVHPAGSAHGFVEVTTGDGQRIALGDLLQRAHGTVVRSELIMRFTDGSLDDETTLYSQRDVYRFISDHHVQRGPSFPKPLDVTIDARRQLIISTDPSGKVRTVHFDMPPDTYNGMAVTLLMNVSPANPETKIAVVAPGDKPRIVHLSVTNAGQVPFTIGGSPQTATDYRVHVEIGGVAGVIAPLIGKEPLDYHVWLVTGPDPAFIREEGQLYQGGPVWRIQQISAEFPK
jgi:hypothetical protein